MLLKFHFKLIGKLKTKNSTELIELISAFQRSELKLNLTIIKLI